MPKTVTATKTSPKASKAPKASHSLGVAPKASKKKAESIPVLAEGLKLVDHTPKNEHHEYLKGWGYSEAEIAVADKQTAEKAAVLRQQVESRERSEAESKKLWDDLKKADTKAVQHATVKVENAFGADVQQGTKAVKATHLIYGHSHTKFFVWAGREQFTVDEIKKVLASFNLPPVSDNSIKTFMYAGRAEARKPGSGNRGEVVTYTPEQVEVLYTAAGRKPLPKVEKKNPKQVLKEVVTKAVADGAEVVTEIKPKAAKKKAKAK